MHVGNFHPLVLHYPIVLLSAVVVFDAVSCFTKKDFEKPALWTLIFAIAFLVPTIITGLFATKFYSPTNAYLVNHRLLAFVTSGFSLVHLIFRLYLRKKSISGRTKWLLLFSVINFVLVTVTADFGGILAFGKSPFR